MTLTQQLFFRFYAIIVISLIAVGWFINLLWSHSNTQEDDLSQVEIIVYLTSNQLELLSPDEQVEYLEKLNSQKQLSFSLLPQSQVTIFGAEKGVPHANQLVVDEENSLFFYKLIPSSNKVLALEVPKYHARNTYDFFWLTGFYLIIAAIIYLTTRPLAKDLLDLEKASSSFAKHNWDAKVDISQTSPVYHLAEAYNQLLTRISQLLNDQKEMSHAISHELRTPLARIKFSLELAQNTEDSQTIKKQLSSITDDINEIHSLIEELLNYASLEKESVKANIEKGDIIQLLEHMVDKLTPHTNEVLLTLKSRASSLNIYCDSYLIERAAQNLIINGLKYAKSKVLVSISISQNHARLIVEDDGPGISPDDYQQVFDSFVRLEKSNNKKGFGLGLAIVRRIAQLHSGRIEVSRSKLGGARFVLSIPQPENPTLP
ncbi:MAG: ATP-binding protein [Kangiellaceae bacterium]|nr:ATP-binding protein [Kangiellaceae bacterium]